MEPATESSRKHFAFNTLLSVVTWCFPLILAFIATPILVRGLGNENYGIFAIALGFVSYAFSSGIGRISAKYIPEFRSSGEPEKISEVISTSFVLTLAVGTLQAVTLAIAAPYIVSDILRVAPESQANVVNALYLASVGGLFLMLGYVFQFVLQGLHRFDNLALISNLSALLLNIGNIAIVLSGYGVSSLLLWNAIVFGLIAFLYYLGSRRLLPELRFSFRFTRNTFISMSKYASSIVIYQTLSSVLFIFERTWIARHFGTETLTFYVIPLMLAFYMHGLLASVAQVLFPVVNELLNDRERMIGVYKKATKMVLVIIVFIVGSYIASGKQFLHVWINEEFARNSYYLLIILSAALGLNAIGMVAWQLAEAFRRPGLNALSTGLWLATSIPLMIILVDWWHSEGVAFARLIGVITTIPIMFYIEKRFLGSFFWRFWLGIGFRVGIAAFAMILTEIVIYQYTEVSWAVLCGTSAAGSLVFGGTLLLVGYFSKDELRVARDMLLRMTGNVG